MDYISENLQLIKEHIESAAKKAGRNPNEVTLIGVTKTIEEERIQRLVDLGVKNLGENRVQELLQKYDNITGKPVWHLIGHLQTNKVKYIVDKVALIHSVDSLKLAQEIDEKSRQHNSVTQLLIEVNIANEESKFGVSENDALKFAESITFLKNVNLKGLMTVAPFVANPEENRGIFYKMRKLFIDIKDKLDHNNNMDFLSMGMTNDYQVAIEEGANLVRIGTGIFGSRI